MTTFIRTLAAVAAGNLIVTTAFAATAERPSRSGHVVEDAQQQARDLLTGHVGRRAAITQNSAKLDLDEDRTESIDAQEQARRLLLAVPAFSHYADPTVAHARTESALTNPRINWDPQESARRMISGGEAAGNLRAKRSASRTRDVEALR